MTNGTNVEITHTNQIAVLPNRFVAEVNDRMKFFRMEHVESVEDISAAVET
jgi:hypothetical protein